MVLPASSARDAFGGRLSGVKDVPLAGRLGALVRVCPRFEFLRHRVTCDTRHL